VTAIPDASDGAGPSKAVPAKPALSKAAPAKPAPSKADGSGSRRADVAALRAEIEQTRAELGQTVQALAAKADVKARFQESADEAKARVLEELRDAPAKAQDLAARTGRAARRNPVPFAAVAGAVVLVVLFIRWRRTR
jgi:ElaB/YqjD/DUF883 family membrane-anchored ribosome-binding protein